MKNKVDELELFINKDEKTNIDEALDKISILEEKVNNLNTEELEKESGVEFTNLDDVYIKIDALENKISNIEFEGFEELKSVVGGLVEDVNNIKENIVEKENNNYDIIENETDIHEIKDKVMFLEKRLYQIIAGELSTKKVVKKDKKNNGQIMLFGEELLSVNDFSQNKEDFDFDELEKPASEQVVQEITNEIENTVVVEEDIVKTDVQEVVGEGFNEEKNEQNNEEVVDDIVQDEIVAEETPKENNEGFVSGGGLFESETPVVAQKEIVEEPVSNYFALDNEEVIQKEKSILVVGEKRSIDERESISKDIIALETEKDENNSVSFDKDDKNDSVIKDKFAYYNIKDIEQILHDSRAIEAKNDKARIEQVWKNMTRGARPEFLSVIETLQEGKVVVVGNKEFIIVFPNVSLCNIVMRRKFKDIAIRLLYGLLGDTYDYAALPIDVWTSKSREYKEQYQIGIRFPVLKPLNVPGLEIANGEAEYKSKKDQTIEKTIELFGKENIIIE